ncbi:MAG: hypothetical protein ACE5KQ_00825 [Thermoplasmata archaeon]
MLEHYGTAVMEARRHDRRLAALEDHFRWEYGSTSGMERSLTEAPPTSSPRSGLRTFLAKIAGFVSRSSTQVATPAASVEQALSVESAEHATSQAQSVIAPRARPVRYSRAFGANPRTALPPLKR